MRRDPHDHSPVIEKAGVVLPWTSVLDRPGEDKTNETMGLVEALGCELGFISPVQLRSPSPSHLFSRGLLDDLVSRLKAEGCSICVVDGALSPVQQRNLERAMELKVIDRTGLILEIFGLRARSKEGQLQVELARLSYERSRLVRTWTHLERQRGGRGFLSGPGETQLEADQRMLDRTLKRLQADLERVRRTRSLQRAGRTRGGVPIIALVGYTNSGKSTLFNRLSGAQVLAKDMPFATLDPTIRRLELPIVGEIAVVDTVGFISDLPTHLIDAFQATLEEIVEADLLVHVRDRASPTDSDQKSDVHAVLARLEHDAGKPLPPIFEVWNKADLLSPSKHAALSASAQEEEPRATLVSAHTGFGVQSVLQRIEGYLLQDIKSVAITLPMAHGQARAWLHQHGEVVSEEVSADGPICLSVRMTQSTRERFEAKFGTISA